MKNYFLHLLVWSGPTVVRVTVVRVADRLHLSSRVVDLGAADNVAGDGHLASEGRFRTVNRQLGARERHGPRNRGRKSSSDRGFRTAACFKGHLMVRRGESDVRSPVVRSQLDRIR